MSHLKIIVFVVTKNLSIMIKYYITEKNVPLLSLKGTVDKTPIVGMNC
jgi:hypothetical protein